MCVCLTQGFYYYKINQINSFEFIFLPIDWLQFIQLWPHCFNCFRAKCNSNATTNQITRNLSSIKLLLLSRYVLKWNEKVAIEICSYLCHKISDLDLCNSAKSPSIDDLIIGNCSMNDDERCTIRANNFWTKFAMILVANGEYVNIYFSIYNVPFYQWCAINEPWDRDGQGRGSKMEIRYDWWMSTDFSIRFVNV